MSCRYIYTSFISRSVVYSGSRLNVPRFSFVFSVFWFKLLVVCSCFQLQSETGLPCYFVFNSYSKGHCHAIGNFIKSLKVSSHQLNFKTNDLVLLFETICRYSNCFVLPVATDGMDGNELKIEKFANFFKF